MVTVGTWDDVVTVLLRHPWRTRMKIPKRGLPHPQAVGLKPSIGMPEGQQADYRYTFRDGTGLHVKDFGAHYIAHLYEPDLGTRSVEELRDPPALFIDGSIALGAAIGGALGKNWESAVAGAAITGLAGAVLAASTEDDATSDDTNEEAPG